MADNIQALLRRLKGGQPLADATGSSSSSVPGSFGPNGHYRLDEPGTPQYAAAKAAGMPDLAGAGNDGGSSGSAGVQTPQNVPTETTVGKPPAPLIRAGDNPENQPPAEVAPKVGPPALGQKSPSSKGTPEENDIAPAASDISSGVSTPAPKVGAEAGATTPSLAPQGPKNPFLRVLSRITGMSAGTPDPGKPYAGPVNAEEKRNALSHFVGGVGDTMQAVSGGGTPQERIARQELPVQKQQVAATQELAKAQLENLSAWRTGQLGVKQQVADTGTAKMKANAETKGLVVGDDGSIRPMTEDEILQHPVLSQNKALAQAAMQSKSAQSDLAKAHQDVLMNPGNPTFQQKEREIQAKLQMARASLAVRQQGLQMQNQKMLYDYGEDTHGNQLTPENAPPQQTADAAGNPIPNKQAGSFRPTSTARARGEQSGAIQDIAKNSLIPLIQKNAGVLGPVMGRYGSLTDFVGDPSPEFAEVKAALMSWIALHPAAHGFRGVKAVQEFEKAFGTPIRTPEALIAGITGSFGTMEGLQRAAQPRTTGPSRVPGPIGNASAKPKPQW